MEVISIQNVLYSFAKNSSEQIGKLCIMKLSICFTGHVHMGKMSNRKPTTCTRDAYRNYALFLCDRFSLI